MALFYFQSECMILHIYDYFPVYTYDFWAVSHIHHEPLLFSVPSVQFFIQNDVVERIALDKKIWELIFQKNESFLLE